MNKGGDAGEITGGLTFDGLIDDEIIVDTAAVATEFVVDGKSYDFTLLNTDATKPVNALVDWGDGTTTEATGRPIYHTYNTAGEHTIKIYPFSADKLRATNTGTKSVNVNTGIKNVFVADGQTNLTKATFADGVETIEGFRDCGNLADVSIPDSVKCLHDGDRAAFKYTPFWDACTSNHMTIIGKVAVEIEYNYNGAIAIPNGVWYIDEYFADYESLNCIITSLTLPSGLKEIGRRAFYVYGSASALTSVSIPATVTSIGDEAFKDNVSLATVTFASGSVLESIGDYAFYRCGLTSITIPASVTSIGSDAFANNSTLTEIHFTGSTPPTITGAIADASVVMVVPVGAKSAYEAAGYTNVYEEGHMPQDISLTWETGAINPTTGADATDSNAERSNSTSNLSEVWAVKWSGELGTVMPYKLMVCCYNKSDGTYAGTYNGTSVVQGESWLHADDYSGEAWNDDLSSLTAYDFRFVINGKWGSAAGQGQYVVVYGTE